MGKKQYSILKIGLIQVLTEIDSPVTTSRAISRIQKKINASNSRRKDLRTRAKARMTASKIILNC